MRGAHPNQSQRMAVMVTLRADRGHDSCWTPAVTVTGSLYVCGIRDVDDGGNSDAQFYISHEEKMDLNLVENLLLFYGVFLLQMFFFHHSRGCSKTMVIRARGPPRKPGT